MDDYDKKMVEKTTRRMYNIGNDITIVMDDIVNFVTNTIELTNV